MAKRRMFSIEVVETDKFLDLSAKAQNLYFHLGMHGDDDGFVASPKRIMRNAGSSEDDLNTLIEAGFIIPFESGVIVITDWKIHNYIQKDRYKETVYKKEKAALSVDESDRYILMDTECIQDVSNSETQVRGDKENLGKENLGESESEQRPLPLLFGSFKNVLLTDSEIEQLKREFVDIETTIESLSEYMAIHGKKYDNHFATLCKWAREDAEKKKPQNSGGDWHKEESQQRYGIWL